MRITVAMLALTLLMVPVGAEAADEPVKAGASVKDARFKTANRMIRIGDVGWATLSALALTGEARGYDETWLRVGLAAGVGAVVTGIMGRRLKSRAEGAERQSVMSISLPPSGRGVGGAWSLSW